MCVRDAIVVAHPRIPVTKAAKALDAINQLAAKLDSVIKNSPVSELEKNARQHFISQLAKQGLVTREEFDTQVALLERARAKLKELEAKIAHLEAERHEAQVRHR
jgi:ubiquinone biosynthesis accessory factor UbiK